MFETYLKLGFEHILDWNGYDHILFIVSICLSANRDSLKKLFFLVTFFTLGHSLTLGLSSIDYIKFTSKIVELIIPITIILSCLDNIHQAIKNENYRPQYFIVLCFGFIHGMGFSTFFKSIIGKEESILFPLFSFNLGVELAQLIIVFITILILLLLKNIGFKQKHLTISFSLIIIGIATFLLIR